MEQILDSFGDHPEYVIGLTLGSMGIAASLIIIAIGSWVAVRNTREREQTKRELAAYVAEGSLTPEDAERIVKPRPWYATGQRGHAMKRPNA